MIVQEALLGFDARSLSPEASAPWTPARRAQFLLRVDVARPLALDPAVWPSVAEGEGWRGPNHALWDDVSRLQRALEPGTFWTIAVSWVSDDGFSATPSGPYREPTMPPVIDARWKRLGFDVADAGFTSALSNCSAPEDERESLRASWASALNEHHLFTDVEKAFAFRRFSDDRVPEHAPFFVYALWHIESSG